MAKKARVGRPKGSFKRVGAPSAVVHFSGDSRIIKAVRSADFLPTIHPNFSAKVEHVLARALRRVGKLPEGVTIE